MLQIWVLIEFDHFLDNLIVVSVEMRVIIVNLGVIPGLLCDPVLLLLVKLSLELAVIFENGSLCGIIVTVSDIVGAFGNFFGATNVIGNQSEAVRAQALQLLSVEATILDCAVVPLLLSGNIVCFSSEFKIVIEEVFSINKLAAVPLGNIATTIGIDECSVSVELTLVKISFVHYLVGESKLAESLIPALFHGSFVLASTPLRHFDLLLFRIINFIF